MSKYVIGVDYGTLSGRAVLVDVSDGRVLSSKSMDYPHGVIDRELPGGLALPESWALEDPEDYLRVLFEIVPYVVRESGAEPEDVIGISLDTTSCTMIPVDRDNVPLCTREALKNNAHAWCKLWKHHGAQGQADRLTELLQKEEPELISLYGGRISSEWMFPKLLQVYEEDSEVFEAADAFLDAMDYLSICLCGEAHASICAASYKALYSERGYPDGGLLEKLAPGFKAAAEQKLRFPVKKQGERAGFLTEEMARKLSLTTKTAVAVGNVDAHVSMPAAGVAKENALLMIIGTSTCAMICSGKRAAPPGICGCVKDGILPELYGYEAGQPCVGDSLDWFVKNQIPAEYEREAEKRGINIHALLSEKAAALKPGESGLLALDWWNGNRSVLVDARLSGLIVGLTLNTRPHELYRALIEATAFGMRKIIDNFILNGVAVDELYACGGITHKNPFFMQLYADVLQREIRVSPCTQAPALGSAMYAAVAAGKENGGYATISEAAEHMADHDYIVYSPHRENYEAYDKLYELYLKLHDIFGVEHKEIMHRLKGV